MLFNSPEFLFVFLPLAIAVFHIAARYSGAALKLALLTASLVFYSYWNVAFLPLLLGSVIANYWIGVRLSRVPTLPLLTIGIGLNLWLLGYFKYSGWFLENVNAVALTSWSVPDTVLPIGISFITFEQIAFIVDAYRGKVKNRKLIDYALFVTFFPQLIAGPIFHHRDMCPQFSLFRKGYGAVPTQVAQGLFLLSVGLFKKVVVADYLATYANPVFADPSSATFFDAWVAALAYTLQLYFDFSAYSEMAMGLALLFGITIPINFNSPYKSASIQEFWQRWHMTLGSFLREYLYIPLGGNRHGLVRTIGALLTVMFLAGLWHGAGWNFIVWGGLHGLFLVVNLGWRVVGTKLPRGPSILLTFFCVVLSWVVFRAESLADAFSLWATMFGVNGLVIPSSLETVFGASSFVEYAQSSFFTGLEPLLLLVVLTAVWQLPNVHVIKSGLKPSFRCWATTVGSMSAAVALLGVPSTFLYWRF